MNTYQNFSAVYSKIWRWHFYASLFVIPFILMLSVSGAFYLFKPQVERWEERNFQGLAMTNPASPNMQLNAALAVYPGASLDSYRLPQVRGDTAMIVLALADGKTMREVFVSPQGKVVGNLNPDMRLIEWTSEIHGSLLAGRIGSWLVELAASWAIVMILTGLYLWWPAKEIGRRRGMAGVVWPRWRLGGRAFLKDLHAVTGFWVAGLALILLLSGMPWASVWGDAFKMVRTEFGLIQGQQDWKTGGKTGGVAGADTGIMAAAHAHSGHDADTMRTPNNQGHDHDAMMRMQAANIPVASLADIVTKAHAEKLAFPVVVKPPGADSGNMVWTVKSNAQNRPLRATITYDMATGNVLTYEKFADRHPIDQAVGYGIAWHEGQLFGWINQAIGVFTALALITLSISGFLMWRRRRPDAVLGAPPARVIPVRMRGAAIILFSVAALLPLLALSLIIIWIFERALLRRMPAVARWIGIEKYS